jgi:hypothetical protein
MSPETAELPALRDREYRLRLEATRLRRLVYADPAAAPDDLLAQLRAAEQRLAEAAAARATAQAGSAHGVIVDNRVDKGLLGPETTKLEVQLTLGMEYLPTSIWHLLKAEMLPLVRCKVRNADSKTRRLRISTHLDGYSAPAVDTVELEAQKEHEFLQLPVMRPSAVAAVSELTRATLNVLVEDLDRGCSPVELHRTVPVWLLARTSAPLAIEDPATGTLRDTTPFFGAFVTPNAPAVMGLLRKAAARHPDGQLVGYQGDVGSQVQAVFETLKGDVALTYVDSVLTSSPDEGFPDQRVRLPRESLESQVANCLDGTVLYASLLEAASLSAAIVVVPGHAFLGWESGEDSGEWHYLETTVTNALPFEQACAAAERTAEHYEGLGAGVDGLRRWPVRLLRSKLRITPME